MCHTNCLNGCYGPTKHECTECTSVNGVYTYFLDLTNELGPTCDSNCPSGYYPDSSNGVCSECDRTTNFCNECSDLTTCLSCVDGYYLKSTTCVSSTNCDLN